MIVDADGYVAVYMPSHHRARRSGYVAQHILVAERALGKPLPAGAVVHHVNEIKSDNRNANLVICHDNAYHKLLHFRARIKSAGGDPNTDRICSTCKRVLPIGAFHRKKADINRECKVCMRNRQGWKPWRPGGLGRPPRGLVV